MPCGTVRTFLEIHFNNMFQIGGLISNFKTHVSTVFFVPACTHFDRVDCCQAHCQKISRQQKTCSSSSLETGIETDINGKILLLLTFGKNSTERKIIASPVLVILAEFSSQNYTKKTSK